MHPFILRLAVLIEEGRGRKRDEVGEREREREREEEKKKSTDSAMRSRYSHAERMTASVFIHYE